MNENSSSRPNILIFCVDQMQSYCLGCNGHPMLRTPNIDAIAAEGVTFTRGYCPNPVCSPSRASMLTGLTPRQHGLLTNGSSLPERVPTLPQLLAESGYRTHAVGKLHLQPIGGLASLPPGASLEQRSDWDDGRITDLPTPYYGFQSVEFVGGHVSFVFGHYRQWLDALDRQTVSAVGPTAASLWDLYNGRHAYHRVGAGYRLDLPEELHYNHWIADRTIDFLKCQKRTAQSAIGNPQSAMPPPFFLLCSFPDPHHPFAACRPYSELYDPASVPLPPHWQDAAEPCDFLRRLGAIRTGYNRCRDEAELREITAQTFGMISHVDACIGRVMATLRDNGLDENTLIAFVADHGEYLGCHNLLLKGAWPYEELMRIPFIWRAPGRRSPRHTVVTPVSLLDLAPTVTDYAGIPFDTIDRLRGPMDRRRPDPPGRSLRALIETGTGAIPPPIFEYDEEGGAETPVCRQRGIVDGDWKLVVWSGFEDGLLVDLASDPLEQHNLWSEPSAQARKTELMRKLLDRLAATDRFDTPRLCPV